MPARLIESTSFEGPTIWSPRPVTRLIVAFDASAGGAHAETINLAEHASELLAELRRALSPRTPHELLPVPEDGDLARLIALLAINLQRLAGVSIEFCATRPTSQVETHEVVVEHTHPTIGGAAGKLAVRLTNALMMGGEPDLDAVAEFRACILPPVSAYWTFNTTQPIVEIARERGIPVGRIDPRGRLIELGNGAYRQRFIDSSTSLMSAFSEEISRDKLVTASYLRAAGLPVPHGGVAREVEHAVKIARRIGFPVVVKPADAGASLGLALDLRTEAQVRERFPVAAAASQSGRVLIERYVEGRDYRIIVVNGTLISIIETMPAHVVGDGTHTIEELVAIENADLRRGYRDTDTRRPITLDDEVIAYLADQNRSLNDIPHVGTMVRLRLKPSMNDGGLAIDWTDDVHPDNAAIILQAAGIVGLDVATIDLIAPDITQSIWETGGAIVDINAHSGFRMQRFPSQGEPRDPFPAILDMLFPLGQPVRAPVVAVVGEEAGSICELVAQMLGSEGRQVGLATTERLMVNGVELRGVVRPGAAGIRAILNNPAIEIAVAEVTAPGIVDEGLGFENCDVAVVTSLSGLMTPFGEQVEMVLARTLGAAGTLVINADDPALERLAQTTPGPVARYHQDGGEVTSVDSGVIDGADDVQAQTGHYAAARMACAAVPGITPASFMHER
jgi:cyanophycin synthetase